MQIHKSKSKKEYELNSKNQTNLSQEEVEKKILKRFNFLNKEGGFNQFFSSYDFRLEEKNMVEVWKQIIDYLLSDIFSSFAIGMSDLKKYTTIKNISPYGLNNILQQLRIEQKYITDEDLKNEKFYQINFPYLYPQTQGYISSFLNNLSSIINFTGAKIGCKDENDNNDQQIIIRTDITDEDKYKIIPDTSIIIHYEKFVNHCNLVLEVLKQILQENDEEVITTNNFKKNIKDRFIAKKEKVNERLALPYGLQYIDHVIYYLMKTKKIALFDIESNNQNIQCIKLLKNENDTIIEKDSAVAKLLIHIDLLENRIKDAQKKYDQLTEKAKEEMKKGNKNGARIYLSKRKNYQKILENSHNTQSILEDQIFTIKNAENNTNMADMLKKCLDVTKDIGMNSDDLADTMSDLKDVKESINEMNEEIKGFKDEKDEEELNKEMENLMLEDKNEKDKKLNFPNPNDENIDDDKELNDLLK